MGNASGVPIPSQPLLDSNGLVTVAWRQFFITLWNRTGGATGNISFTIDGSTSVALSPTTPGGLIAARSDADAASKGVGVGKFYRNGSVTQIRIT